MSFLLARIDHQVARIAAWLRECATERRRGFSSRSAGDFLDSEIPDGPYVPGFDHADELNDAEAEMEVHEPACTCFWVPEHMWTTHYAAVEPGSQREWNPECPVHPPDEKEVWIGSVDALTLDEVVISDDTLRTEIDMPRQQQLDDRRAREYADRLFAPKSSPVQSPASAPGDGVPEEGCVLPRSAPSSGQPFLDAGLVTAAANQLRLWFDCNAMTDERQEYLAELIPELRDLATRLDQK